MWKSALKIEITETGIRMTKILISEKNILFKWGGAIWTGRNSKRREDATRFTVRANMNSDAENWHGVFLQEYKKRLPPYTEQELEFPGVKVTGVEVETVDATRRNVFETFWQQSDIDLSRGLDFSPRGPVYARLTHLNHKPFHYNIDVSIRTRPEPTRF